MTDQRPSDFAALAEGEALSAYLSGELDPAATEALEARLLEDAQLSGRLERMREMLESLRRLEDVSPPEGYAGRLRDRLNAERRGGVAAAEAGAATAGAGDSATDQREVRSIASAPSRRRAAWAAVGTVAAGLIALAVVAPNVLRLAGEDAGEEAAEAPMTLSELAEEGAPAAGEDGVNDLLADDAGAEETAADGAGRAEPAPEADEATDAAVLQAQQPVIVDDGAELADDAELAEYFSDLPEAQELLGTDVSAAEDLAAAYRIAAQREQAFASGAQPADCLEPLVADAGSPLVLARAESLTYQGSPALAYVLVGATADSESLDRVELWVVDPDSCRTRTFLDLTP